MALDYSKEIDVVEDISARDFHEKYYKPQIPVKIKGLLKDSPAYKKWNIDFFKECAGDYKVGVFDDGEDILDRPNNIATEHMMFGEYLDLINSGPTSKRLFLFDIVKANKSLKKDIVLPKQVKRILPNTIFAFFGGEGAYTRIHRDADNSNVFLSEFNSEKKVILFDSKYDELLYRYPFTIHSGINVEDPDYEKYPGLQYVTGMHTHLRKGETLFMPAKYWHFIRYNGPGIGFSFRSVGNFKNTVTGLWHVTFVMQFDKLMRKTVGEKWFNYKTKLAQKRANKAIEKFKKYGANAL